jgi:hypothetical protein
VTSAGQRNATLLEWRFVYLVGSCRVKQQLGWKLDLPATALACSIRLAYQAADASHPNRAERARRRARMFRRTVHFLVKHQRRKLP